MAAFSAGNPRADGKFFEEVFDRFARYAGFLPKKNDLSARWIGPRKLQATKSELDYRVIARDGRVGYFDCKSFRGDFFTYSEIDRDQLQKAVEFNEWNVPSGFVVWLRGVNRVVFFSGRLIADAGPGARFTPWMGVSLGSIETLNLGPIMAKSGAP